MTGAENLLSTDSSETFVQSLILSDLLTYVKYLLNKRVTHTNFVNICAIFYTSDEILQAKLLLSQNSDLLKTKAGKPARTRNNPSKDQDEKDRNLFEVKQIVQLLATLDALQSPLVFVSTLSRLPPIECNEFDNLLISTKLNELEKKVNSITNFNQKAESLIENIDNATKKVISSLSLDTSA